MLQLYSLRSLMQGSKKNQGMAPLGNNFRPPQPLHNRLVRTNIDFNLRKVYINNIRLPPMIINRCTFGRVQGVGKYSIF